MNSLNAEILKVYAFRDLALEGFGKFKNGAFILNNDYTLTGETAPHIKNTVEIAVGLFNSRGEVTFEAFSGSLNDLFGNNLNGFVGKLFHQPLVERGLVKPKSSLFNFGSGYTSEGKELKKKYKTTLDLLDNQFETYRKFKPEELKHLILKLEKYVVISSSYYDIVDYIKQYGLNNFIFNNMSEDNERYGYLIDIIENTKDTDSLIEAIS